MAVIDKIVGASGDDCQKFWNPGLVLWDFSIISLYFQGGKNTAVNAEKIESAARFTGVSIPDGATITAAYLTLKCNFASGGTVVRTRLQGEQSETAAAFTNLANYDARVWTTAVVDWDGLVAWVDNVSGILHFHSYIQFDLKCHTPHYRITDVYIEHYQSQQLA